MPNLSHNNLPDEASLLREENAQLKDSLSEYYDFFDNSPAMLASIDPYLATVLECNQTLVKVLNYPSKEAIIGLSLKSLYHHSCHRKITEILETFHITGALSNIELTLRTYDNNIRPCLLNATAVRDAHGKIMHSRSAWTDLSQLKLAQEQTKNVREELNTVERSLQQSQAELSQWHTFSNTMSEINTDGWWDWDLTSKDSAYFSNGLKANLGYSPEEAPNTVSWIRSRVHPDDLADLDQISLNHIRRGDIFRAHTRLRCKDGSYRYFICRGSAISDHRGRKNRLIGSFTDITALELSKQNLQTKNEELSQFGYRTSHDLRSPLIAINGLCKCIALDIDAGDLQEAKTNVLRIQERSQVLSTLVSDILELARADLADEDAEAIDIDLLLAKLQTMAQEQAAVSSVKMIFLNEASGELHSQPTRLTQVLYNLISNAIKYANQERESCFVRVRFSTQGDSCRIDIEDNGMGIPQEHQDRLFQRFQRFHPEIAVGSGLGLSIVKSNVEKLQATIDFESSEQGTRFSLVLP